MNVRLLRRVQRAIVKHPRQFVMSSFFARLDSTGKTASGCGTAACIAGWAVHLSSKNESLAESDMAFDSICSRAAKLLGLRSSQVHDLFLAHCWPLEFYGAYCTSKTALGKARVAARRIEHFIKTKGEE